MICVIIPRDQLKKARKFRKRRRYFLLKLNKLPPYRWVSEVDTLCPITRSVTPHYKTVIVFCSPLQLSYRSLLFYTFCSARYNLDSQNKKSRKNLDPCKKSCHSKDCLLSPNCVLNFPGFLLSPQYDACNFKGTTTGSGSPEDYSLFLSENGHLSFENPNYQASLVLLISLLHH